MYQGPLARHFIITLQLCSLSVCLGCDNTALTGSPTSSTVLAPLNKLTWTPRLVPAAAAEVVVVMVKTAILRECSTLTSRWCLGVEGQKVLVEEEVTRGIKQVVEEERRSP